VRPIHPALVVLLAFAAVVEVLLVCWAFGWLWF
jgi:hypothetical protein